MIGMESICPEDKCTGCFACVNACPKQCISMQEDNLGALHPVIDQTKCIDCGMCVKTCPVNREIDFKSPLKCYAAWRTDGKARLDSASGGIGALFSEFVVGKGGAVFGTAYDSDMIPRGVCVETREGLEVLKGSKYVQSIVGDIYRDIRNKLNRGRQVIYISTPCQIAGLYGFLKKDYDNLLTVDLICHGVAPTSYFLSELDYIKNKKGIKRITNVTFRSNRKKSNYVLRIFNGKDCVYQKTAYQEYYFSGFLKGITLRENCYACRYARPERISDITIGDFIGIGKDVQFNGPVNVSAVIVNTEKGNRFVEDIYESNNNQVVFEERQYSDAVKYGPSLRAPFPRHKLSTKFIAEYPKHGFAIAIRKTLRAEKTKDFWKNTFQKYCIRAPKKLIRIIFGL